MLEDDHCLTESNAILNYLASGTIYQPEDPWRRAKVLQWQFFEQYSHEPYIAVARFIARYLGLPEERKQEYEDKKKGGYRALAIMEHRLRENRFLVGSDATIADLSLYAYTHVAHEGGFCLDDYPAIQDWLVRIASLPGFIEMKD